MRSMLAEKICDGRFLRLVDGLLQAGYLEDRRYHETLSGAPQGGILSPLLSNIYLSRLDRYVETTLLPAYNLGDRRRPYLPYMRMHKAVWKLEKKGVREGTRQMRRDCSSSLPVTPATPATGGCIMLAMRMTGCWAIRARGGKPRISRARSGGSWATA
jgi:hypothetical protein